MSFRAWSMFSLPRSRWRRFSSIKIPTSPNHAGPKGKLHQSKGVNRQASRRASPPGLCDVRTFSDVLPNKLRLKVFNR